MEADAEVNEDVLALKEAWRNEQCGPELLSIDEALVKRVLEQVENQVPRMHVRAHEHSRLC